LPLAPTGDAPIERAAARAVAPELPSIAGVRVLVVDDELSARQVATAILRRGGAVVLTAASAEEAMQILGTLRPDVLVSDIEMPGEDGYAFIRRIRGLDASEGGKTPAIALTAYGRMEDRLRALSAGYSMHVPKPVDPVELAAIIASLAGR
ncbi:MAG: response regulator, partial [Candidatus Rokuibacteriota bacterium]